MNRLQFATLLSWAGEDGVLGRKRLQKVVFALQHLGCPLDCKFILHHYGPYSRDVADVCDEMVAADLIEETVPDDVGQRSYRYRLKSRTRDLLQQSSKKSAQLEAVEATGKTLLQEDLWTLELGSTILYFYQQNCDWDASMSEACKFKKVAPSEGKSISAFEFAKRMVSPTALQS